MYLELFNAKLYVVIEFMHTLLLLQHVNCCMTVIACQEFRTPTESRLAALMQFDASITYSTIQIRGFWNHEMALQFGLLLMHRRLH